MRYTTRVERFKDIFSRVLLVNDETQMSNKYKIRNEAKTDLTIEME